MLRIEHGPGAMPRIHAAPCDGAAPLLQERAALRASTQIDLELPFAALVPSRPASLPFHD